MVVIDREDAVAQLQSFGSSEALIALVNEHVKAGWEVVGLGVRSVARGLVCVCAGLERAGRRLLVYEGELERGGDGRGWRGWRAWTRNRICVGPDGVCGPDYRERSRVRESRRLRSEWRSVSAVAESPGPQSLDSPTR